jgi:hypothetical protein
MKRRRRASRRRPGPGIPHTIVFFVSCARTIPIPSGAGYVFSDVDPAPRMRVDPEPTGIRPRPLRPDWREVALRFWQFERHPASASEPLDVLDQTMSVVLPATVRKKRPRAGSDPPIPPGLFLTTSIEMATRLRREPDPIQLAFRRCVDCLRDVHRAYRFATRSVVTPVGVGDLGLMAFFITHAAGRWQPTLSTYWITSNMDAWVARELSDPKQVEDMHVMLRRFREGDAFASLQNADHGR